MERKFIKKSQPFGQQRPPAPPTMTGPGGGGPPPPPAPAGNSAPGGAVSPPKPPGAPAGGPTPPKPPQAPTEPNKGLSDNPGMKPRTPGDAPAPGGGSGAPTDVQIDAATGHITIKKGPINFTIAKYSPDSPPDQVKHLPSNYQRQWVHIVNKSIDSGDNEETAFKKAWGTVPDKYKKSKEGAGEWPPAGYDNSWAPEEDQFTDEGTETPSNFEEETPAVGAFNPGESIKYIDPDNGRERYGFVVELKENGLYTVNFDDGSTKDLHEGWLIAAPEAPNADQQYNNYQDVYANLRKAFFPKTADEIPYRRYEQDKPEVGDTVTYIPGAFMPPEQGIVVESYPESDTYICHDIGDDPSHVYQIGLSSIQSFSKGNKVTATHQDWIDFKENKNELQYGDWGEETTYSKEYHDNPFSMPKNRLTPPLFTIKATVPDYLEPRSIAYALQTQINKDVDVSGQTLTIKDVEQPWSLITELGEAGIDARTTEDLLKFDQGVKDFKQGMKVAMVGDFPDMNYYYDPTVPAAQAYVLSKTGSKYILENEQWGRFEAEEREMDYVRS